MLGRVRFWTSWGIGNELRQNFGHMAIGILVGARAFNDVAVLQANFVAGEQAEEGFARNFLVIGAFNPKLFSKLEMTLAPFRVMRMDGRVTVIQFTFTHERIPIGDGQLDGVEDGHGAGSLWI